MRALIAFDKFKDSLSATQACELTARVLRTNHRDWELDLCPLTDGGEGFEHILGGSTAGQRIGLQVSGPLGSLMSAGLTLIPADSVPPPALALLRIPDGPRRTAHIAVIEMAVASGLALVPEAARDPWQTTSYGTGQLVRAAAELGAAAVLLGIGGSATHDLGLGALSALGLEFRTERGEKLRHPIPAHWSKIVRIEGEPFTALPSIRIACDVTNPLLGPRGAAAVYAPQKGLTADRYQELEAESERLARLLCAHCRQPDSLAELPGTGAAGGISFGLMCATGASLLPGFDLVSAWLDLDRRIARADIVITGEGRFDQSSLSGKGPGAIAMRALALGKTTHVFAGRVQISEQRGLHAHAITPPEMNLPEALRRGADNLADAVRRVI